MKRVLAVVVVLLLLLVGGRAGAHGSRTGYLDVTITSETDAVVMLRGEGLSVRADACTTAPLGGGALRVHCREGVAGASLEVEGLAGADAVVARVASESGAIEGGVLTARSPRFAVPGHEPIRGVLARYLRLGIEHVVSGVDHVLFLLALVWQAVSAARGRLRGAAVELARTATAFTLAHTLTLTLTVLGLLHVPTVVGEASIAASLVLVAADADAHERTGALGRAALAGAFGLVHGLGFATALSGGELPEHALWTGLAAFDVGVEIGQVLVLGTCLVLVAGARRVLSSPDRILATVTSYAVGVTGAFLFFARAAALLASRSLP